MFVDFVLVSIVGMCVTTVVLELLRVLHGEIFQAWVPLIAILLWPIGLPMLTLILYAAFRAEEMEAPAEQEGDQGVHP